MLETWPRVEWLEDWEKRAILDFYWQHPLDGYRRLTYKMLDADVVAISASSVYRVLKTAGVLDRHNMKPSRKGKGFEQPSGPHKQWYDPRKDFTLLATIEWQAGTVSPDDQK